MLRLEHINLVSREWWQSWWLLFSQVRAAGRMASPVKISDLKHNMMVTRKNIVSGDAGRCSYRACSEATLASSVSGSTGSRVQTAGSVRYGKSCEHSKKLRFYSLNLGTIK